MTNTVRRENRMLHDLAVKLYAELKAKPGHGETRLLSVKEALYVRNVMIRMATKEGGFKVRGRNEVSDGQREMFIRFGRGSYKFWLESLVDEEDEEQGGEFSA